MALAKCSVCGSEFDGRSDARYCSGRCRQQALRDRGRSEAIVNVGGIQAPVTSFVATSAAFGEAGTATIELAGLKGDPHRNASHTIPVELTVSGELVWSGDVARLTRAIDTGAITVHALGLEGRLAAQQCPGGFAQNANAFTVAGQVASGAGFRYSAPETVPDARPLAVMAQADGAPECTVDALRLLLWAARSLGLTFTVRPDGELVFAAPPIGEPRIVEAHSLTMTSFDRDAPVRAIVRSTAPIPNRYTSQPELLCSGSIADVPPGIGVYVYSLFGRREVELAPLAERLTAEITRDVVRVEGEAETPDIAPHDAIRIKADGLHELSLTVLRVEHRFEDGALRTRFSALHLPPPPRVPSVVGAAADARVILPQIGVAA